MVLNIISTILNLIMLITVFSAVSSHKDTVGANEVDGALILTITSLCNIFAIWT